MTRDKFELHLHRAFGPQPHFDGDALTGTDIAPFAVFRAWNGRGERAVLFFEDEAQIDAAIAALLDARHALTAKLERAA